MPTPEKEKRIGTIKENIEASSGFVFVKYFQLKVREMETLRARLKEVDCQLQVVKKTLASMALESTGHGDMKDMLDGSVAIAYAKDDVFGSLKLLADFSKEVKADRFAFLGGFVDNRTYRGEEMKVIANLPSREELIARLVAGIKSPLSNLVYTIKGPISSLVNTMSQIAEQKKEAA